MRAPILTGFLAGYLLLDWASYIHPLQQSSITPWNPHPALAIALIALLGQRWIPAVFAAVVLAEVVVRKMPAGLPATILVSVVLTLGYAAMAAALSELVATRNALETRRGLARLVGVVTVGSLITGSLYVGALWAGGATLPERYFPAMLQFWIGDCVGILVTLPPVLLWSDPLRRAELRSALREPVALAQGVSIAAALWLVFSPVFEQPFKFFYLLFLPLVWVAARFGLAGSAFALVAIQCGIIVAAHLTEYPALTVFELQTLLIALAITGLFLGVTVDERRRAARELRQSLRLAAAGEMSAALAHELNQPLAALGTYARSAVLLAAAPELDRGRLGDTLEKALAEANRAAEVVRRLRDFFRSGATDLRLSSLPGVAATVIESMQPRASRLGVDLERCIDERTPEVLIDSLQIEVVLRNLLANGVEAALASPAPRSVRVEIGWDEAGFVRAVVRDSGAGVAPEMRDRVFEPLWSSRASGMGMGLAISRAIVEAHGGQIWVETDGRGVFGFKLPLPHG